MDAKQREELARAKDRRARERKKRGQVRYFYVNGHLHKRLSVNRSADLMTAWDYVDGKRKMYVLSDVRKRMQHAFGVSDAARILNRHRMTITKYISQGLVPEPQRIRDMFTGEPGKHVLSEDDIFNLHEYMLTVHYGRPRKDGLITNLDMPTREQLKALVKQQVMLYIEDDKGNFVPVWKEQVF